MPVPCLAPGYPPGCQGGYTWSIERRKVKTRVERGYCVVEDFKVVLPREACKVVNEVAEGRLPGHLLLLGPPGTGKSTLLKIIEDVSPFRVYTVHPEEMLSPFVGETEQKFTSLLKEAEGAAPSIILIDEADMLLARRAESGGRDALSNISANVVRILLRFLQDTKGVSVVASTNKPLSAIDPALTRHGRFRPIYFPPPTVEAAELLFELYGREPPPRDELARVVAKAVSWSNLVEYIETGRLRRYELNPSVKLVEPVAGCGVKLPSMAVLAIHPPLNIAYAALAAGSAGRLVLLLLDPEYSEDIVWLASSMDAIVAIPYSPAMVQVAYKIVYRVKRALLLGPEWLEVFRKATVLEQDAFAKSCVNLMDEQGCVSMDDCARSILDKILGWDGEEP